MEKRNATVAVIGAGDYIGAEIAKKFAAEGFIVFAGRRDDAKLAPLVRQIEAAGGSIVARAQDPDVKAKLIENTQAAVERGAFGSPTFFVGKEMFFGKEQLREVEELVSGG